MTDRSPPAEPPAWRRSVALLVIGAATAQIFGHTLRTPTQLEANDISRWCTVWSLVERGTYSIDDCPWHTKTQDKVRKPEPFYRGTGTPPEHYYSSKPPLLPTIIAAIVYPFRIATGVPLDKTVLQERNERWVAKEDPTQPGGVSYVKETPKEPVRWPVYVFYLKPIVVLLNVVPMVVFLALYIRLLDRFAPDDWSWLVSLFAAAWGTYLFVFEPTLNNHTVAAYSAFFALVPALRIWDSRLPSPRDLVLCGFFAAFTACNELPAAVFGIALFLMLLARSPRETLLWFVPAAAVPCLAFLATQYLAMGQFRPAYEEFGTKAYNYEGSYWNTPLEFDWFNKYPEPKWLYLLHMTLGHHGVLSLTPIFLFSAYGAIRGLRGPGRALSSLSWLTIGLTVAMVAFYTWNPKARNYGGSTQGLRWLFWLIPLWLAVLPLGLRKSLKWISLAALLASIFSVGYGLRTPWSHPWVLDWIEHMSWYHLER